MAADTKEENFADLKRQAALTSRAEPAIPKLSLLTKASAHPELQRAFEQYDQQMEEWQRRRTTGSS